MLSDFFGWTGSALFAICGLPQAAQSYREKHSDGLNWYFLLAWFFGELFTLLYIWPKSDWPLIANYSVNMVMLCVILYYKINPTGRQVIASV